MPLWRDRSALRPNVTQGLLSFLSSSFKRDIAPEDLAAYVYGLAATPAFAARFGAELAEGAGPVRIPLTADVLLFDQAVELGQELLWWHTFGERFGHDAGLPVGRASELAVSGMPESAKYNAERCEIEVGSGRFGPVTPAVWQFEVSGLKVVQSWLGYRKAERKGKRSSPLDEEGPERWTFTDELLTLLAIIEHTIELTPIAAKLLEDVVCGPLLDAASLPKPSNAERSN